MMRTWCVPLVALAIVGCESPEATRSRGGGRGADLQNRPPVIEMHGGSQQYWDTPVLIPEAAEPPSLDAARHAQKAGSAP